MLLERRLLFLYACCFVCSIHDTTRVIFQPDQFTASCISFRFELFPI